MKPISNDCHRFPADVIAHAVWLYFRLTMSFRDVEDLLAERGIDVSYETIAVGRSNLALVLRRIFTGRGRTRRQIGISTKW